MDETVVFASVVRLVQECTLMAVSGQRLGLGLGSIPRWKAVNTRVLIAGSNH